MTTVVGSERFNAERSELLRSVRVNGESFAIQFHGRPCAALVPYKQLQEEREELADLRALVANLKTELQEAADLEGKLRRPQEHDAERS